MNAKHLLLLALAAVTAAFTVFWLRDLAAPPAPTLARRPGQAGASPRRWPNAWELAVGVITDFLDTLGIGSYATTTSLYRLRRSVPDELLPGTLSVGHALPSILQAFLYTTIVDVEAKTLIGMIAAAMLGAWLGAGAVSRWSRRTVQIGMGSALLAAASLMLARLTGSIPGGGSALGLEGAALAIGIAGNFFLGALMTSGVGLYAPCMILVSLLGMNPIAAFPIMMGSCAFLMPVANLRFVARRRYAVPAALGLTLGGLPAVLVAAFVVQSLPLDAVRWLVVAIASATGVNMLRAAGRETSAGAIHG